MSFLSAIVVIALFVMVPVLLSLRKTGVPGITNFTLACALCAVAAAIGLTSAVTPAWFHAGVRGMMIFAAALASWNGFNEFIGRKPVEARIATAVLVSTTIAFMLVLSITHSAYACLVIASLSAALIYAATAAVIVENWRREKAIAPYMILCAIAAIGMSALRVAAVLADYILVSGFAEDRVLGATYMIGRQMTAPLFFLTIILMLHGWIIASLRHLVAHDELTGALSRRAFMDEYEKVPEAMKAGSGQFALMLLDIDRFKQINDRNGHAGGDVALRHFARTVERALDERGMFGRLGGEEFGVLLKADHETAVRIAEEICQAVRSSPAILGKGKHITLTVSIGIAITDSETTKEELDLMIDADAALYEAKAAGRDRCIVSDEPYEASRSSARVLAGAAAQMRAATERPSPDDHAPIYIEGR